MGSYAITCGECGAAVTAENKEKKQKNGVVRKYVYYHCTKRKNPNCTQKSVEVQELHSQILSSIESLDIPKEFHEYAMKFVLSGNEKAEVDTNAIEVSRERTLTAIEMKISNLVDLRTADQISVEIFSKKHQEYLKEKSRLEQGKPKYKQDDMETEAKMNELLTFSELAKKKFLKGENGVRKNVLSSLGSNLLLMDKILSIDIEKSLLPIQKLSKVVSVIKEEFEPLNSVERQRLFEQKCSESSVLLDIVRDIGTFWKQNKELIWIPNIKQGFFGITQPTEAEMASFSLTH